MAVENDFNRVMKEYVTIKYGPIAEECALFYDQLREKYPQKNVYKNTKEFRQWVKTEIVKYIDEHEANNADEHEANNAAEHEANNAAAEHEANNAAAAEHEANNAAAEHEANNAAEHEANNAAAEHEANNAAAEHEANNAAAEHEANNAAAEYQAQIEFADHEIQDILNQLENGGVPLGDDDDEGIKLDLYEELQGITEDFDYEKEVDNVFW